MPKRPRRISVDDLPPSARERIAKYATVSAAVASINPVDPLRSIRALGVIAAAHGLKGEVDEETLTIRLYAFGEDEETP